MVTVEIERASNGYLVKDNFGVWVENTKVFLTLDEVIVHLRQRFNHFDDVILTSLEYKGKLT